MVAVAASGQWRMHAGDAGVVHQHCQPTQPIHFREQVMDVGLMRGIGVYGHGLATGRLDLLHHGSSTLLVVGIAEHHLVSRTRGSQCNCLADAATATCNQEYLGAQWFPLLRVVELGIGDGRIAFEQMLEAAIGAQPAAVRRAVYRSVASEMVMGGCVGSTFTPFLAYRNR